MPILLNPPLPRPGDAPWRWRGLHGSARALALAEAVAADTRPWVFIAADTRELERLAAELRFFGGRGARDPDAAGLGSAALRRVLAASGHRLASACARCRACRSSTRGILLLTADSLLARLPPVSYVQARSFELKTRRGARDRAAARALDRIRLCQRQPGHQSGRVCAARLAVRCLSDGQRRRRCASICWTIASTRSAASIPTRSARSRASSSCGCCRRARLPLDAEAVKAFRRRYRARFEGDVTRMPIYRGVSEGIAPPGIEFYLPLFFEATAAQITDYLPQQAVIASDLRLDDGAASAAWEASARATRIAATTSSVRCCRRPRRSCDPRDVLRGARRPIRWSSIERFASADLRAQRVRCTIFAPRRRRSSASMRAPRSRSRR